MIPRMFAVKNDRVQVMTGSDEHRGHIYNSFCVVKRNGKWGVEESRVDDIRATYDLEEIRRRGGIEYLTNRTCNRFFAKCRAYVCDAI
jgi:hypothetical protein